MRRRGTTYIEVGLMLIILSLLTAVALPNLVRMQQQRKDSLFRAKLREMATEARAAARESGDPVALNFDRSEREFQAIREGRDGTPTVLRKLPLPEFVQTVTFAADKYESPPNGWRLPFYPDGSSAGGGVQLDVDGRSVSLFVPAGDGRIEILDGELPDMARAKWPAGTYAAR